VADPGQEEYASELKRVYKEIDKFSNLMTPLRDVDECVWKTSKRSSMRPRGSKDASTKNSGSPSKNWQDDTNA